MGVPFWRHHLGVTIHSFRMLSWTAVRRRWHVIKRGLISGVGSVLVEIVWMQISIWMSKWGVTTESVVSIIFIYCPVVAIAGMMVAGCVAITMGWCWAAIGAVAIAMATS